MTGDPLCGQSVSAFSTPSRSCFAITLLKATIATLLPATARPSGCMIRTTRRTSPKVLPAPGPASTRITFASSFMSGRTSVPRTPMFQGLVKSYASITPQLSIQQALRSCHPHRFPDQGGPAAPRQRQDYYSEFIVSFSLNPVKI